MTIRTIRVSYSTKCVVCGQQIGKGEEAVYAPSLKYIAHVHCAEHTNPQAFFEKRVSAVLQVAEQLKEIKDQGCFLLKDYGDIDSMVDVLKRGSKTDLNSVGDEDVKKAMFRIEHYRERCSDFIEAIKRNSCYVCTATQPLMCRVLYPEKELKPVPWERK